VTSPEHHQGQAVPFSLCIRPEDSGQPCTWFLLVRNTPIVSRLLDLFHRISRFLNVLPRSWSPGQSLNTVTADHPTARVCSTPEPHVAHAG